MAGGQDGLFGTRLSFVPIAEAQASGEKVRVPYETAQVKDAPNIEADGELSQQEEQQLYRHYGIDYGESRSDSRLPEGRAGLRDQSSRAGDPPPEGGPTGNDVSGPETVETRHETARVEREPITDANVDDAMDGPEISEEEHEVVLHSEEPVVEKRAVPKERVRLGKEEIADETEVSETVRKERIEADGNQGRPDR